MPDFKIVSDFNPTGDQPNAVDALVKGAQQGIQIIDLSNGIGVRNVDFQRQAGSSSPGR